MIHHIRRYSVVKIVDGRRTVLAAFSCGPCRLYAKYYHTPEVRERNIGAHCSE